MAKENKYAFALTGVQAVDAAGRNLNPWYGHGWAQDPQTGMSLRAYIATKAMPVADSLGDMTVEQAAKELGISTEEYRCATHYPKLLAKRAVAIADALILELNKEESK